MSLQDSLPERRNLTLISLAFIAFFYGGGQFSENEVKLIIINASFTKPIVLSFIAWLSFAWFNWRYWLVTKGEFTSKFIGEVNKVSKNEFTYKYVSERIPYKFTDFTGLVPSKKLIGYAWNGDVNLKGLMLQATIKHYAILYVRNHKKPTESESNLSKYLQDNPQPDFVVKFNDIHGFVYIFYIFIKNSLLQVSFSTYIFPYILSLGAIIGAFI